MRLQKTSKLEKLVGGLSTPSKMPTFSYGLPARECKIGSILRKRSNTTCSKCYAMKGMYVFPNVYKAQYRRLRLLSNDLHKWEQAMITLLRAKLAKREKIFRWHDSGDLQSVEHFEAIVRIARALPSVKFWLPTRERQIVSDYTRDRTIPRNLVVRVSATTIGQTQKPVNGTVSSSVGAGKGYACPAYRQGGHCGDCRACWKRSVKNVDYPLH